MEAGKLAPLGPIIQYPQGLPCQTGRYALCPVIRKSFRKHERKAGVSQRAARHSRTRREWRAVQRARRYSAYIESITACIYSASAICGRMSTESPSKYVTGSSRQRLAMTAATVDM